MIRRLLAHTEVRSFAKFSIVGVLNTIVDATVFFTLTQYVPWFAAHLLAANAVSFCFGFTNSYIFNRRWTFRSTDPNIRRQLTRFLAVMLVGLGFSQVTLALVHDATQSRVLAKLVAIAVTVLWNYFAGRRWAFNR